MSETAHHGTCEMPVRMSNPQSTSGMDARPGPGDPGWRNDSQITIHTSSTGLLRNIPVAISRGIRVDSEGGFRLPKGAFR